MEMCIDNPREGFGELFDTHPSVESRVAALVKFAGGHDPGPLALPPAASDATDDQPGLAAPSPGGPAGPWASENASSAASATPGPWSEPQTEAPAQPNAVPSAESAPGPWDPHRSN
jgi:heat shock protein HtpX